ncbi:stage III sporulation protein AF [Oceanobacillus halotolerans]|uniref:stage III sporulation protein AF n=1 Tax=Oceanobacillus halotolerans TaxID=2663380 RepID=UPI0013D95F8C|nr:stage III sporulation protein AF [Oceanobacillus halotolerans]
MNMLIDWITQIIIFVLLATIIDLLIPQTSMKKYIKLVVGLILLLIFLKPIFYLFDVNLDKVLQEPLDGLTVDQITEEDTENLIESQKVDIQSQQHAYILEEMAVQLKELAKDPLEEEFQLELTDLEFRFQNEADLTYEGLQEVIVYLKQIDREGAVQNVDEVVIDTEKPLQEDDEELDEEKIKQTLADIWEIRDKDITLEWEGGTS